MSFLGDSSGACASGASGACASEAEPSAYTASDTSVGQKRQMDTEALRERKRRIVKRYNSDEGEDQEENALVTHETLVQKCKGAIAAGNFYKSAGRNAGSLGSLYFWC